MPRKRSRAVGSPQGQEQERGPGQPSAAPPQGRGFLCAGGAAELCPESWVARSAANWGQLGRVVARPPPDEALAAAPRANGGKEKEVERKKREEKKNGGGGGRGARSQLLKGGGRARYPLLQIFWGGDCCN